MFSHADLQITHSKLIKMYIHIMRLVKIGSRGELSLTDNTNVDTPRYSILSHTWGANHEEVTFNDLKEGSGRSKMGYAKIQFCGKQARKDGLQYF